jgi:hypothetical protein
MLLTCVLLLSQKICLCSNHDSTKQQAAARANQTHPFLTHEGSKVGCHLGVVLREGLHLALGALAALLGQEAQVAVAGSLELQIIATKMGVRWEVGRDYRVNGASWGKCKISGCSGEAAPEAKLSSL